MTGSMPLAVSSPASPMADVQGAIQAAAAVMRNRFTPATLGVVSRMDRIVAEMLP